MTTFPSFFVRSLRVVGLFAFAVGLVAPAFAQASAPVPAKQAITVVLNSYGQAYRDRLVAVVGQRGGHQPSVWHIMAYDLKESRRLSYFQVANGKIVQATLLSEEQSKGRMGPAFSMNDLRKNSTDAFVIANASAVAAKVGFDALSYEIVGRGPGQAPVYNLELRDVEERVVGILIVDAASGKVVSSRWEDTPQATAYASPLDRIDWDRVKTTTKKVGSDIGNGFRQFGQSVKRTFTGE